MRKTVLQLCSVFVLLLLSPAGLFAQARFWVGGTGGNWNDPLRWSTVSGGAGGAGAPTATQDALFDANSFTTPGSQVVVTGGATCRRMNWTGVTNNPVLSLTNALTIAGNNNAFVLDNNMSVTGSADLLFTHPNNITLTLGTVGKTLGPLVFTGNDPRTITLNTGDGTHTHSLGSVSVGNNANFVVNGNSAKAYGGLTTGTNAACTFRGSSQFTGTVLIDGRADFLAGAGLVLGGATPVSATFRGAANNTFQTVTASDNSTVTFSNAGTNAFVGVTVNSGVRWKFSTGGTSTLSGNFTVNAVPCGAAYAELNSNTGTTQATVLFNGFPNRDHVNISNLNNTGPIINVLAGTGSNNNRITFPSPAGRRTLYWVGGTGNWSNPNGWSTVSGGTGRTCPPAAGDDVVFDANSFTAPGQTVTVDAGAACNNMTWATATNAPTFALNNPLTVNGTSFILANAMTTTGGGAIMFTNAGNVSLYLGTAPKNLGNLVFNPTASLRTISIDGTNGGPHALGTLTAGNATLTLAGTAAKTINGVSLSNVTGSFAGSNTFTGAVSITGGMGFNNATFAAAAASTLNGNFTFTGTTAFTGTGSVTFAGAGSNTFGNVTAGPAAVSLSFANGGNNSFTQFTLNNNGAGAAVVTFTNGGANGYQGIAISNGGTGSSTWRFTAVGTSSVAGSLTVSSSTCTGVILSSAGATAASVQLASAQNISGAAVGNVSITGAGLTVTSGQDNGGNAGVQFINSPRTLYWRTNDGNWNDPGKWVVWNGVAFVPAGCPPTGADDVVFDNASFTQSFKRVTVNTHARCRNMNWVGIAVAQSPIFECPAANTLTINGSLELSSATVTTSFGGKVIFASTTPGRTIRTAGRSLTAIDFNGPGGSWQLLDGLNGSGTLSLIAGTLDANGQVINVNALNANGTGNLSRTLRLGSATHVLKGIGTALDLRGDDGNFLLDAGTSTILCTGNPGMAGLLTVETGTFPKTLPHLSFSGAGRYTLSTTGVTTNRITFGDLLFSSNNQKIITVNGNNPKTYGNIQINGNRNNVTINGASAVLPGGNVFGAVTFGDTYTGTRATFNGNNVFNGPVSIHANGPGSADLVLFTGSNAFNGTFTARLASTAGTELQFASTGPHTTAFYGPVSINPGNTDSDAWFNNATTFHPGADLSIGGATSVEFRGTGNNTFADVFVNGAVSATSVTLGNGGSSSFRNVTLDATTTPAYPSSGITWKFKSGNAVMSVFSGMMHIRAACQAPVVVESDATAQARVAFNSPQVWNNNVLARNLHAVNAAGSITVFQPAITSTNVISPATTDNRTLYWVGGTGSWSDPFRWSTSSGGNGGACIPTANDDVFFDAGSGLGAGRIVAVTDGPAFCRGMNWTGIPAATTTVFDLTTHSLEINGSLTLAPGLSVLPAATSPNGPAFLFTNSNTANAATIALNNRNIHTPAGTTALLPNVLFDAPGVTWSLSGPAAFGVSYQLGLGAGTLRANATTVACNHLTTNLPGDLARTLDVGNAHLVINGDITTGQYNVLDLRGANLHFATPGSNAKVQFTRGTQFLAVQTGDVPKELPDLLFESIPASPTAGPADIDIYTSDVASRITFRGIRITRATGTEMYVKGSCPKTYKGPLVFPDGFNRNSPDQRAFNGTDDPAPNNNIFAGPVSFGNHCGVSFYNNNTFLGTVTFGTGTGSSGGVVFRDNNTFAGKVTIAGTKDDNNAVLFAGTNFFRSGAALEITATTGTPARSTPTVQFNNLGGTSTFNDHVTLQGPRAIYRFNGSAYFTGTDKKATIGAQTRAWFIGGSATSGSGEPVPGPGEYVFSGALQLDDQSLARFRNNAGNGYNHVVMDEYTILELTALPGRVSTIQGDFTVVGSCAVWTQVTSSFGGVAATAAFARSQTWQGTIVQDINNTGPGTVTVSSGIDQGNNANFLFTGTNLATGTLVWVGGNPLNLSTNNYWNNPRNWARPPLDDAKRANGGSCIPGSETDVLFNEESFGLAGTGTKPAAQLRTIFVNLAEASCGSMTWTDNVNQLTGTSLPGLLGGVPDNQIEVNGALVFAPPDRMFNDFDGTFKFNLNSAPYFRQLDANGGDGPDEPVTRFAGPVEFANVSATWRLESDLLINANSGQGDFIITYGTVLANGRTITLDGDWLIKSPLGGNPQGKFEAGTAGKVLFNGGNTGRAQMIVAATSPFWDVEISRGEAGNPAHVTHDHNTPNACGPLHPNSFVITLNKNELFPLEATAGTTARLNAAANGVTVKHNLTITRGHLWDYGYQLIGNTDGGGTLTVRDEGVLSLGNANGGNGSGPDNNSPLTTIYPAGYAGTARNDLAKKSTVSYAANGHQDVSAVPVYGNLYFRNPNCADAGLAAIGSACQRKRIALGPLRVDGDLTLEDGIHLVDNGFQIAGNAAGTSRLTMGSGAILTLGSGNAAIATTTGAGADPVNNTTGLTTIAASASAFPQHIAVANLNLDPNSVIIYQASVPQPVKALNSATANGQYGHLVVQNATPGAILTKELDGPVQVRSSIVINPGSVLVDNGHQISYTGSGGQTFRMASGATSTGASRVQDLGRQQADAFLTINNVASGLVLGSPTRATAFPGYADAELNFDPNTTITYHAGIAQSIRGLSDGGGPVAGQRQYANLVLTNPTTVSPSLIPKTLTGPVVIRGGLTIHPNNNLVDGGNGMVGTSGQPFVMRSLNPAPHPATSGTTGTAGPSRLTLGTATAATGFPAGYRTGDGTAASPSDIHFEPGTTVVYASGRPQHIEGLGGTGNTAYANLTLINPAATPAATGLPALVFPTVKTLTSRPTTVRGNLTIHPNNTLFDNGLQLDGASGLQFRMYSTTPADPETGGPVGGSGGQSRLVLGKASAATHFPAGFRTGDGSAVAPSDIYFEPGTAVVYNAGVAQPVQVLGNGGNTAYADLLLSNPVSTGAVLVDKPLQAPAGSGATGTMVRGTFTIGPNNHLIDNGFQLNGTAGRTFSMRNTTLAVNAARTFTTDAPTTGTAGPSRLTIGTATKGTAFPTGYQTLNGTDINLEPNTTVVYNAGVDQPVQALMTTGSLTANANYAHVVLANPAGSGFSTKTLTAGNARIRGNLTINANNTLDAGAGNGTLFLQGDWTGNGRFTARTGTVVMEGEALQTMIHSNTAASELSSTPEADQDFYNWVINKAAGAVVLQSRLAVSGTATFTRGLVHAGLLGGAALTVSPANVLIFRDNATAVGASNQSFVTGAVRKTGNDAFLFPVGAAGVTPPANAAPAVPEPNLHRPVGMSAPAGMAAFIAQYQYAHPGAAGFDPARMQAAALNQADPLVKVSAMEYWMLNREAPGATAGAADVFVTLSWHDPQSGGVGKATANAPATPLDYQWLRVARWNGTTWQNMGGAGFGPNPVGGAAASNLGGTVTSQYNEGGTPGPVDQFSPFTLASLIPNNPLPVTLVNFKGHLAQAYVLLNWQTVSEANTAHFEVERSRDGIRFAPVAVVQAKGNTSEVQLYQARDTNPFNGLSYYRLKMVDADGRFEYSKIISISAYSGNAGNTVLYPNPNEGRQLFVASTDPATRLVAVYDLVGRKVLYQETNLGGAKWEVKFNQGLKPGMYLAVVAGKVGTPPERIRFVVR
jgi:hypothetical protein